MKNKIDVNKVLKNASIKSEDERSLGLFDLSILGIGAMIGTGILVLTGIVAATTAGPAVIFSFLVAAIASGLIGLCYSELSTTIPNSGSAYIYAWVTIGQVMAFFAGWTLLGVYINIPCSSTYIGTCFIQRWEVFNYARTYKCGSTNYGHLHAIKAKLLSNQCTNN